MFKIAVKSESFAGFIRRYPTLSQLFRFKLNHIPDVKDDALRSELYDEIYTENNTAKSTKVRRFEGIDDFSLKYLSSDKNVIHDIGVSNGVTSVEFHDAIRQSGRDAEFYISDKYSTYYFSGKFITRVFSTDKRLVGGYVFFIVADNGSSPVFFVSRLLLYFLKMLPEPAELNKITLYDKKTLSYLEDNILREIYYDVFETNIEGKFTFVRCMNLLQSSYFNEQQIERGLNNIKLSLRDSGILQIGRTMQNGTNNVSFYQKVGTKFIVAEHVNEGYENNDLVLSI